MESKSKPLLEKKNEEVSRDSMIDVINSSMCGPLFQDDTNNKYAILTVFSPSTRVFEKKYFVKIEKKKK